jgi:hypothetical protein
VHRSVTKDTIIDWLLEESQPSVRYFALTDLMGRGPDDADVLNSRAAIPTRGWAKEILSKQRRDGTWVSSKSLYRPKYVATNWMALMLADLGLTKEDPRIARTAQRFFEMWLGEESSANIYKDEVCIVGNTARMLTRFGYGGDPRVRRLFDRLLEDQRADGGWNCSQAGHGTLDGWEALAAFAATPSPLRSREIEASIERGAEFYLERNLLDEGKRYLPWYRLHYPNHYYYDVLVGLDILTRLGYGADKRLGKALDVLRGKRLKDGSWPMDRVHPDPSSYAWGKGNLRSRVTPFALERAGRPSKWITLTALRVLGRTGGRALLG